MRRFGEPELQELCDRTNLREEATGDLSPGGPGHTKDDVPELQQPPLWLYGRNFRVAPIGNQTKKPGIVCDLWIDKDHLQDAATFPRRSIELWEREKTIDWIALLRRAPQRELGLLTFERGEAPLYYSRSGQRPIAARLSPRGKLRYAMEDSMPEPAAATAFPSATNGAAPVGGPAQGEELSPEHKDMAEKFMAHYERSHPVVRYAKACYDALDEGERGQYAPKVAALPPPLLPLLPPRRLLLPLPRRYPACNETVTWFASAAWNVSSTR